MNDNEVKNAFDHIEPEPGAQERMYANILKKAAAQREDQNAEENIEEKHPTVQKCKTIPIWQAALGQLSRLPCYCDCRRICTFSFPRPIRAG